MIESTVSSFWAFYLYLIMLLIQWAIATVSKAKLPTAVPGKIDDELSHDSFAFRAHRTFQNSLENSVLFVGAVILAFALGMNSWLFTLCMWIYVLARTGHMALYYLIATEKNPSPRTYFFLISLLANILMLALICIRMFV
ncbi:MAG: hypothetical protein Alis3KO_30330 [Aliiglaciecola sp.]